MAGGSDIRIVRRPGPLRLIGREFSRIRLTVWLLIVMAVVMIVGSVFPQGYDPSTYIESWGEGRYHVLARLGLLNLFHTNFFIILGIVLLVNVVACSVLRWVGRRGGGLLTAGPPRGFARTVAMKGGSVDAWAHAHSVLIQRGYTITSESEGLITARRGPWPEGVSLLYHLALGLAIVGFIVSALTAFGGDITLYTGEPVDVPIAQTGTGLQRIENGLADMHLGGWHPFAAARPDTEAWAGQAVTLTLNSFLTEWELYEGDYYPKDWFSDVNVNVPGDTSDVWRESHVIEVNRPLRAAGLTFYQMAYEQAFDVVVTRNGNVIERVPAQAYVPFSLESVGGMFFPGTMRVGTLYEKYKEPVPIVPHVPLKWQPPEEAAPGDTGAAPQAAADTTAGAAVDSAGFAQARADETKEPPARVELGNLSAGEPLAVEDVVLTLENPEEGSVLSYRHDPGVPLLYIAIIAFILGLAIRTYWPSYRIHLWIEPGPSGTAGSLVFRATGMLGEPEEIEDAIADALSE